ncbi:adenosylcobinamide-phosphate synthase CbiB [Celeribacter sp.]|uniref:adenosylcobinamide-phosphate synthase CbiB n=1 Tax=Celeribacter sp. TaxID=1890673 RepID=UPI003A9347FD
MSTGLALLLALLLDAALGEPRWLWSRVPHPAVVMGRLIGWADERFNAGDHRIAKGAVLILALVLLSGVAGYVLALFPLLDIVVAAILLAHRSLVDHVGAVAKALTTGLREGRAEVGKIVGRDTAEMTPDAVARAAIESAAENFSDGVVAPAFWFLIGGLPAMLIYKMVNTADSMIGYRTERHEEFGKAAARLDDLLNLIPARLTALFIALTHLRIEPVGIAHDAARHRSPNAGWPEAAMARALDVALAGPRSYGGTLTPFPWVHPDGRRDAQPADITRACGALWRVWGVMVAVTAIVAFA